MSLMKLMLTGTDGGGGHARLRLVTALTRYAPSGELVRELTRNVMTDIDVAAPPRELQLLLAAHPDPKVAGRLRWSSESLAAEVARTLAGRCDLSADLRVAAFVSASLDVSDPDLIADLLDGDWTVTLPGGVAWKLATRSSLPVELRRELAVHAATTDGITERWQGEDDVSFLRDAPETVEQIVAAITPGDLDGRLLGWLLSVWPTDRPLDVFEPHLNSGDAWAEVMRDDLLAGLVATHPLAGDLAATIDTRRRGVYESRVTDRIRTLAAAARGETCDVPLGKQDDAVRQVAWQVTRQLLDRVESDPTFAQLLFSVVPTWTGSVDELIATVEQLLDRGKGAAAAS